MYTDLKVYIHTAPISTYICTIFISPSIFATYNPRCTGFVVYRKKQILSVLELIIRTPVLDQYVIFAFKTELGPTKFSRIWGGNNNFSTSGYDLAACLIIKAFANGNAVCCHTHTRRLYQLQLQTNYARGGNCKFSVLYFSEGICHTYKSSPFSIFAIPCCELLLFFSVLYFDAVGKFHSVIRRKFNKDK